MFGRTLVSLDIAELFGDRAAIGAMLAFERELARAQVAAGLVPPSSAETIARIAALERPDPDAMVRDAAHAGSLAIPFVKWLRGRVEAHDRMPPATSISGRRARTCSTRRWSSARATRWIESVDMRQRRSMRRSRWPALMQSTG